MKRSSHGLAALLTLAAVGCGRAGEPATPKCAPAAASSATNTSPDAPASVTLEGFSFVPLQHAVYADATTTAEERASLERWSGDALAAIQRFFGATKDEAPLIVSCKTDACEVRFSGPTRRSRARMSPRPMVVINGIGPLTPGTILHELVHVEMARRLARTSGGVLPAWFHEGVAVFIGDNVPCPPDTKPAIDDLRRLDAPRSWEGFTNMSGKMTPAYCQVHREIAAWVDRRGKKALLDVIDAVADGKPFDEVYGPLVTAIPPEKYDRSLDARFSFDENDGTSAVDKGVGSHIGSLMSGAVWTTGHNGSAVKVRHGAYVRADDFVDFGVPDSPFSISLWVKPLTNAKVLVHTAMRTGGGDGWCLPLLGYDSRGHLAAQVNFQPDARSFLTAMGPIPPLGKWSHVAVTWSANLGVRLFVNGALAASAAPRSPEERHREAPASPAYLFLGGDAGGRCWTEAIERGSFDGAFDELHVYDYALSPEQVADDMRVP